MVDSDKILREALQVLNDELIRLDKKLKDLNDELIFVRVQVTQLEHQIVSLGKVPVTRTKP